MKVNLICSTQTQPLLRELLAGRGMVIDSQAEVCIIESGFPPPPDHLCILFQPNNLPALLDLLNRLSGTNEDTNKIIGRLDDDRFTVISHEQVLFFEARGNYTFCVTQAGEYRVKEKLYEWEGRLPAAKFIRISKSFIVNIENVTEILPWFGRRLILRFAGSKREVEVSKNYVKTFKEFLGF